MVLGFKQLKRFKATKSEPTPHAASQSSVGEESQESLEEEYVTPAHTYGLCAIENATEDFGLQRLQEELKEVFIDFGDMGINNDPLRIIGKDVMFPSRQEGSFDKYTTKQQFRTTRTRNKMSQVTFIRVESFNSHRTAIYSTSSASTFSRPSLIIRQGLK